MEEIIASVKSLCTSINAMEFSSPGIFTNAMITRPELTTLIRDALLAEQQLYKISSSTVLTGGSLRQDAFSKVSQSTTILKDPFADLQAERVDGRSVPVGERKTAVMPPVVTTEKPKFDDAMSLPTKRKIASQYSLISRQAIESDNPIEMCDAILGVDQENPTIKGLFHSKQKALSLKIEYERLMKENESFGSEGLSIDAEGQDIVYNLLARDINELISKEQAEIESLEKQLELV